MSQAFGQLIFKKCLFSLLPTVVFISINHPIMTFLGYDNQKLFSYKIINFYFYSSRQCAGPGLTIQFR